jgi:UDP-glucose 4-epimerase
MHILVTGGAGYIGSHALLDWTTEKTIEDICADFLLLAIAEPTWLREVV